MNYIHIRRPQYIDFYLLSLHKQKYYRVSVPTGNVNVSSFRKQKYLFALHGLAYSRVVENKQR